MQSDDFDFRWCHFHTGKRGYWLNVKSCRRLPKCTELQVLYYGYGGYIGDGKYKCHECVIWPGTSDKWIKKAMNAASMFTLLPPCAQCMETSSMHEKRGTEWVRIFPTAIQLAHVYKMPDRSLPAIPERSLRAILDRPAEPVANTAPFLTVDPASSSMPPPAQMSASQSQEGSHIWSVGSTTLPFDIPARGWSSPSTDLLPLTEKVDRLQQHMLDMQERIVTVESERYSVAELHTKLESMQERIVTLESERGSVQELQQSIVQLQEWNTMLETERMKTADSGRHAVEELKTNLQQLQQRNTELQQSIAMLETERMKTADSERHAVEELQKSIEQLQERNTEGAQRRQVEAVEGDGVDDFEYVAGGASSPPTDVAAQ